MMSFPGDHTNTEKGSDSLILEVLSASSDQIQHSRRDCCSGPGSGAAGAAMILKMFYPV